MQPIITSLLDTDTYKLSVFAAIKTIEDPDMRPQYVPFIDKYSLTKYEFKNRNNIEFTPAMAEQIQYQIGLLGRLSFTEDEIEYISKIKCFHKIHDCYDLFEGFQFKPNEEVDFFYNQISKQISIKIISREWSKAMFYETFILSIMNEVYYNNMVLGEEDKYFMLGVHDLEKKIGLIKDHNMKYSKDAPYKFSGGLDIIEFGTRRRASKKWQEEMILVLKNCVPENFFGTSNVLQAMINNVQPIGTHGHEYLMGFQSIVPPQFSQVIALTEWQDIYGDNLSIALTDTLGNDKFRMDMNNNPLLLRDYKGFRHDSGDPIEWADMMFHLFKVNGIDPLEKTFVFSDGLDIPKAIDLYDKLHDKVTVMFGIGTDLSFSPGFGIKVPQNVIKMTKCHGQPVAKLSANPEKAMCKDEIYLAYLKHAISWV